MGGDLAVPAARPSKASVENAILAIISAGLTPSELRVSSDGSFEVGLAQSTNNVQTEEQLGGHARAPSWDEVS